MLALRAPLLAGTALAASLALTACQPGEEAAPRTEITEAEAEAGLAAFNLAEPGRITWEARSFEDGVYTFEGVTIDPEDTDTPVRVETLTLAAPRVEDGAARFDRLSIEGTRIDDDTSSMSVASYVIEQPGPELSQLVADWFNFNFEDGEDPDPEALEGWSFARVAMTGVDVEIDEPGEGEASLVLERLEADGFDGDTLERAVMSGFVFDGVAPDTGAFSGRLDEVSVEGLGAAFVRMIAASGDEANAIPPMTFDPSNTYDRFAIAGLNVNVGGARLDMPLMEGEVTERGGEIRQTASMETLTLDADPDAGPMGAQLADGLARLGYESLAFSYAADSVYDRDADRVRTEGENFFLIEDAMRVSLDQDLSGIEAYMDRYMEAVRDGALQEGELPPDVFAPLTIHAMSLTIEDLSLLERALEAAAEAQGSSPAQLRLQAGAIVAMGLAMAPAEIPRPFVTALGGAVNSFIQNGGSITVAMDPAEPVSVGEIMESGSKLDTDRLGLTVTAEPPQE